MTLDKLPSISETCFFHVHNESITVATSTDWWEDCKGFIFILVSEDTGDTELKSRDSFLRDPVTPSYLQNNIYAKDTLRNHRGPD